MSVTINHHYYLGTLMNSNRDDLINLSKSWIQEASRLKYFHDLTWMGRPVIQVPQDMYAIQDLVWAYKPDLIIETGIAHGGSLILSATFLALLDYCEAVQKGSLLDPKASRRKVIGVDIDIRLNNKIAILAHPMAHKIEMYQGSSIDENIVSQIRKASEGYDRIMLFLDSNHTHDHVLAELRAYAPMVSKGSYCVVMDTGVEDLPEGFVTDRPWGKGNNPKTAVFEYLRELSISPTIALDGLPLVLKIDKEIESKIAITAAPDGFLKRV